MNLLTNPILAMHAAGLLSVVALAFRDQLRLRITLFLSTALTILYATVSVSEPEWQSILWNVITLAINLWGITFILYDRTHLGLSPDEEKLFSAFGSLSPGEFRRLLRLASWHRSEGQATLTREGEIPDRLFYVLAGTVEVIKGNRTIRLDAQTFIGEVAFLRNVPASATVVVGEGASYVAWPVTALSRSLEKQEALRIAVVRLISADMALKVAKA